MLSEEYADYTDMEYLELTLTNYADSRNSVSISCKIPEGVTHEAIKAVFEKYGYSY